MKHWSKNLDESGVKVRIYARAGSSAIWFSVVLKKDSDVQMANARHGKDLVKGDKLRLSLDTANKKHATETAIAMAKDFAEVRLTGRQSQNIALGRVFALYFQLKATNLSPKWRAAAEMRRDLFLRSMGAEQPVQDISEVQVERFCQERRSNRLAPDRQGRKINAVRDGTLDGDFRWLSSVFNWARKHKKGGQGLIADNPLRDLGWPKERNPRKPIASHDRYVRTLAEADAVDPRGRLRCILALARYAGRREGAICALRDSDVLRTPEAVRAALADAGMDEREVEHMPNGAIRWSAASDKMGYLFVSPLSPSAREELDRYLLPMLPPASEEAPLFPSDDDARVSIRTDVASRWLLKAEAMAGLPKIRGGIFHPYRRLWATLRKNEADVDVAAAGGWGDTRAMKLSYQQATGAGVLRAVEIEG